MAETKKGTNKSSGGSRRFLIKNPRQMAKRDVKLAIQPQLQGLKRERGVVKDDYKEYMNQLGFLYNMVGENLGQIGKTVGNQTEGVMKDYSRGASGLLESLGLGSSTAPDAAAYARALGSQALAGENALGTMSSDALQTNASMRNQGELERLVSGRNAMGQKQDVLDQLRQQKLDIQANRPAMLKQRLDELRQLAWEQWMAEREFRLRTASARQDDRGWAAFDKYMLRQNRGKKPNKKKGGKKNNNNGGGGQVQGNGGVPPAGSGMP